LAKHGNEVVEVCWSIEERNFYLQYYLVLIFIYNILKLFIVGWFLVLIKKSANNIYLKLLKFPKMKLYKLFCQNKLFQIQNIKFPPLIFNVAHWPKPFWMFVKPKFWTPKM
jgi:hypothetical protein